MPDAPVGVWEDGPSDSKVVATHACLLNKGEVLFFHCRCYPMWSRIYNSEDNSITSENLVVPIWPEPPIEPSAIFCSGHCFLPNGKLLVAGGERPRPYPDVYLQQQPNRGDLIIHLSLIQ